MTSTRTMSFAASLLLACIFATVSLAAENDKSSTDAKAEKGTVHTVEARMGYPTGGGVGIQAEKQPGEFTIPKGSKGTKLKYSFHDPKSATTLTKLNGRNVYSVTEHRYMNELDGNPDFALPPGDYKFVVGGQPGAIGTLSYTTAAGGPDNTTTVIKDNVPAAEIPRNGRLSISLWVTENPAVKFQWQCEIKDGVVTGRGDVPNTPTAHIQNYRAEYSFQGKVAGKQITGTALQKLSWESKPNESGTMKHTYDGKGEVQWNLRADHTVAGTEVVNGITNGKPSVKNMKIAWVGTWRTSEEPAAKP